MAAAAAIACSAGPAAAQQLEPLPFFDLDAGAFTVRAGQDGTTATDLGLSPSELASRLNGFAFGGSIYPVRARSTAIGFGAQGLFGRGIATVPGATGAAPFLVQTYVTGIAGEVSLNFGHRNGWSYISAGAGPMRIDTFVGSAPLAEPPGKVTVNFGGGARWFIYTHLGIGFDVRFYLTQGNPSDPPAFPGRGKRRVLLVTGRFSIK